MGGVCEKIARETVYLVSVVVRVFLELCRLGWRYPLVEASVTESSWVKRLPPADQRLHPPIRRVPETNHSIGYYFKLGILAIN